jgi:spore germination cell wall hydrolase CwlJ-like protein
MYNSQSLDTKRVSTTWKMLLAILSITFVCQTISTSAYANVLPKSVQMVEPTKQKITTTSAISTEVAIQETTTETITTTSAISKEVEIKETTPEETITTTPVISTEAAIEKPNTETITTTSAISKEATVEQNSAIARLSSLVKTEEKIQYSDTDLFCLAKNIYHEARGEPIKGRYAVAQVTINRSKHRKFSGSICDVVFAPYQFSWANNHSQRWSTPKGASWKDARQIAIDVLENGKRVKGMEKALYFHSKHVSPGWRNVERLIQIGSHIFYK